MIRGFFSTKLSHEQKVALALHEQIVAAARDPILYLRGGVPDTMEGRLECIALHAFFVFRRMSGQDEWDEIGGALSDEIVADLDWSLREMGVGDMLIGKRVKKLAQVFFGRFDAYWGAVTGSEGAEDLETVLRRGVFQGLPIGPERIQAMLGYFDLQSKHLYCQEEAAILKGRLTFAPAWEPFAALNDILPAA